MKKIININLSGRVIPIEDAAYERLQRYIESLRRYFAHEEGRDEIIGDIESRISELMSDKIKKGTAAITEEDMDGIIHTMGRIEDFEEAEAGDATTAAAAAGAGTGAAADESAFTRITGRRPRGRLYRNSNDRLLAGVCSGLANYFDLDPTIVRVVFLVLAFGGGFSLLAYLALWIFVPKRPLQPNSAKRFFRNPDERIIGGVAGGIAAYFRWDVWVVRLVFAGPFLLNVLLGVLGAVFNSNHHHMFPDFFFGSLTGTAFLTYFVLWIILPLAQSPFEKMEMRGENVDVHRIRENVKSEIENLKTHTQSFAEDVRNSAKEFSSRATEFANTRGKAFAGEFGQAARPIATSAGHVIATILKVIVLFFAGMMALAFFGTLIALLFTGIGEALNNFILEGRFQKVMGWGGLLLLFGVPFVALITWIIRRLMRVRNTNRAIGWVFGGLWLIGLIMSIAFAASMARSFQHTGEVRNNVEATGIRNKMTVRVVEPPIEYNGYYSFIDHTEPGFDINDDSLKLSDVRLQVEKSLDSQYHVLVEKRSLGANRGLAQLRAQRLNYLTEVQDSFLNLGSGFGVGRAQKWRVQHIVVRIQVPVGKKLRFEESVHERLNPMQIHVDVRGDRRWRQNWESNWDEDYSNNFSWKSNVDYVMSADGDLVDPNPPADANIQTDKPAGTNGVYEYHHTDTVPANGKRRQTEAPEQPEQPEQPERREAPEARVNYTPTPVLATFSLVAS